MEKDERSQAKKKETAYVKEYLSQLTDLQKKAMNIAENHLGLSFNIPKSVGYSEYKKK